jgi:hypothetical protein
LLAILSTLVCWASMPLAALYKARIIMKTPLLCRDVLS